MKKVLTVGELRKAIEGVPDNLEVRLSSDTGVGQGVGRIVVESAKRVKYGLPNGTTGVDYFDIYANDIDPDDMEEGSEE